MVPPSGIELLTPPLPRLVPTKKPIFISSLEWENKKVVGKWLSRNNAVKSMAYKVPKGRPVRGRVIDL